MKLLSRPVLDGRYAWSSPSAARRTPPQPSARPTSSRTPSRRARSRTRRSVQRREDGALRAKDLRPGLLDPKADPTALTRWALVDATGAIVAQSGGFEVIAAYPTLPNTAPEGQPSNALRANGNVYLDANEPLGNNGIVATVALQNRIDQNGDGITGGRAPGADANPEFSGEIAASMCGVTDQTPTNCAPPGTQNDRAFVVSPRMSDGSVTSGAGTAADPGTRKRFYVVITGDSSDYVRPTS